MILNVVANFFRGMKPSSRLDIGGLREYQCEDVSISTLTAEVGTAYDGKRSYRFRGSFHVHSSTDQKVGINLLLYDEKHQQLLTAGKAKISVEEGDDEQFSISTTVTPRAAKAIDEAKSLLLQVVLAVERD